MSYFLMAERRDGGEVSLGVYGVYGDAYEAQVVEARRQQYRENADKPYRRFWILAR